MTNQVLESADVVSQQGVPTPAGGVTSGQPPSSGQVTFTAEQWAEVEKLVERKAQSIKDRRFQELENSVAELRNTAPAPAQPVQPVQAQVPSSANGVTQAAQPAAPVDYLAPLKVVGLDANDNEVLALMVKHNGDQVAYNAALLALKTARMSQPPASAVAIPAPAGNVATNGKPSISDIKDPAKLYELAREQGAKLPGRNG